MPTPLVDGRLQVEAVRDALIEVDAAVYVIKSTVPPGTSDLLALETGKALAFSPEYAGETVNANGYDYPFVILGGPREATDRVAELYKSRFTGEIDIRKTDALTAELAKFAENAFLATKVTFVNEFALLADRLGVDRDELRELWLLDPRIGRSHSFAFRDQPYYDSKCLQKDVPGIIAAANEAGIDMPLLRTVVTVNEIRKQNTLIAKGIYDAAKAIEVSEMAEDEEYSDTEEMTAMTDGDTP